MSEPVNLHGCAIRIGDLGILIRGPARSGKSSLALSTLRRCTALNLEALLVADDRVVVAQDGGNAISMSAPAALAGLIEVSGIGILREPFAASARLGLVVDLVDAAGIERLPEPRTAEILGQAIRRVELPAREAGFGADILASLVLSPPVNDV
ncbi:HPr kinase/phosphorylase [Aurantimonas coralicida]|uniref:HPr kinase/phosphorylase n=1 Tax=Aurantimonas coralicida TaxID=182270 RepID=UPI002395A3E1|nr:HPr kinase/phosphorylase [Aurantimonas coralicida]MDE0922121.1 HPr kinase/phosphorylase [Aurantimonas coralicida]